MSKIPTSDDLKDLPEEGGPVLGTLYIEHSKGFRVRRNLANGELELWHDGRFQASWTVADEAVPGLLQQLLSIAFDLGRDALKRELRTLIGAR